MEGDKNEQLAKPVNNHYKWHLFYYNPDDSRIIVPKECKWLGWTLNFGNKKTYYWLGAVTAAILGCVVYAKKSGKKMHYSFAELKEKINSTIKKDYSVCNKHTRSGRYLSADPPCQDSPQI